VLSRRQQAPVGCGQGFGSQEVQSPCQLPEQPTWATRVQAPLPAQQAPVGPGCGQGFGLQEVHSPCQTLGEAQLAGS
jgi:hypothetical protein